MNCQQDKLYAAERQVPVGGHFHTVGAMQRWVDDMRDTWWWQLWYPNVRRVDVHPRDGRCSCSVGAFNAANRSGIVEMLRVHWTELVVIHELAHVLADARHGSHSHDPAFARVYLELVALIMGPATYSQLYDQFEAAGIQHDFEDDRLGQARRMPRHW